MIVDEQHASPLPVAPATRFSWQHAPASAETTGSQASTTSVPLRGAVTIVSDAPIRSARSCMLVMPKPRGSTDRARCRGRRRRPTAAVRSIGRPTRGSVIRRAREWRTALVSASCAMPMISRSTRVAEARQLVDGDVDRHVVVRCPMSASALERRSRHPRRRRRSGEAHRPTAAPPSDACARDRPQSRCFARDRDGQRCRRLAARALQLHQDRREALREVVVDIARQTVALLENRLSSLFHGGCRSTTTAVVQRERGLTRDRLDQLDAPPLPSVGRISAARGSTPSSSPVCGRRGTSGVAMVRPHPCRFARSMHFRIRRAGRRPRIRSSASARRVRLDAPAIAWHGSRRRTRSRPRRWIAPSGRRRESRSFATPSTGRSAALSSISHTPHVWLSSVSSTIAFVSAPKKSVDVRLAARADRSRA